MYIRSIKAWLIGALLLTIQGNTALAFGPKQEFSRTINREFSTTALGTTALYNKYGKVNVSTWANNSVKIDITIIVNASNQGCADKMFNRINVNFTNTAGYVKAETFISDNNSNWSNWDCGGNWLTGNATGGQGFKINYDIWMPATNNLDLKNKYGNAYVAALQGKLYAEIKYGNLRTETLAQDADLYLGYGKASIAKVNNVYGTISYSDLDIVEAREIQAEAKYSNFKIGRAAALRMSAGYSDFELGDIDELRMDARYTDVIARGIQVCFFKGQYSDLKVANLAKILDTDQSYGSARIDQVSRNFTYITVVSRYTDVSLGIQPGANYTFDLEGSYTDLDVPAGATVLRESKSGSRKTMTGHFGDGNTSSTLKARLSYGELSIR
jgi:hypothetical protein